MNDTPSTPEHPQGANTSDGAMNRPRRILVVEDDGDMRQLNTDVLSGHGYHVEAAENGEVAWNTLQTSKYDLMVTDNDMPRISGIELLKKVQAARMPLPVIMATGSLPDADFARHHGIQLAGLLLKPYTSDELLGKVREVLRA